MVAPEGRRENSPVPEPLGKSSSQFSLAPAGSRTASHDKAKTRADGRSTPAPHSLPLQVGRRVAEQKGPSSRPRGPEQAGDARGKPLGWGQRVWPESVPSRGLAGCLRRHPRAPGGDSRWSLPRSAALLLTPGPGRSARLGRVSAGGWAGSGVHTRNGGGCFCPPWLSTWGPLSRPHAAAQQGSARDLEVPSKSPQSQFCCAAHPRINTPPSQTQVSDVKIRPVPSAAITAGRWEGGLNPRSPAPSTRPSDAALRSPLTAAEGRQTGVSPGHEHALRALPQPWPHSFLTKGVGTDLSLLFTFTRSVPRNF